MSVSSIVWSIVFLYYVNIHIGSNDWYIFPLFYNILCQINIVINCVLLCCRSFDIYDLWSIVDTSLLNSPCLYCTFAKFINNLIEVYFGHISKPNLSSQFHTLYLILCELFLTKLSKNSYLNYQTVGLNLTHRGLVAPCDHIARVGNSVPAWNVSLWLLWRVRCDKCDGIVEAKLI